ncbi:MAG: argininosuccinate lyase [Thermoleophilaceae bacterium]|nr:argininosuccinate lyase [Thermoleophilaceae bacterium]
MTSPQRFSTGPDPLFQRLNASIRYDVRLAPYDIEQSLAHAQMLCAQGIIAPDDLEAIEGGLAAVQNEFDEGTFEVQPDDEDIHMAIERRLIEIAGPVGGKLHTARSRNDQVATDMALFVRAHALAARELVTDLMRTLHEVAGRHLDWALPGYTHLQRAQPVYLSHHLLAWLWKFNRDRDRFGFVLSAVDELPLGAGALAGVNFDTDRKAVADELGFRSVVPNSIDAVSNRDFVLDYLSAAATCATHLSQLGTEIVLWSTEEFGFCQVSDAWASGSSIMPQKKNPDVAELMRAKAPRIVGHLSALHGALHGTPLTYNKDLQEDKEGLFDTVDTLEGLLVAASRMLATIEYRRERMAAAAADEFTAAVDVADALVRQGVPFRESHGIVAGLVRVALEQGKTLSELGPKELDEIAPGLDGAVHEALAEHGWLESKVSPGGTALARVREQLAAAALVVDEGER